MTKACEVSNYSRPLAMMTRNSYGMDNPPDTRSQRLEYIRHRAKHSVGYSQLRVGVVSGYVSPSFGGVHAFIADVVSAIKSCSSDHTFIIYEEELQRPGAFSGKPAWRRAAGRTVRALSIGRVVGWAARQISPSSGHSVSAFEEFVRTSEIDLVWFLLPYHDPVSVPYVATPYDLQHRVQPCFPEVSHRWKERERSYAAVLPRATRIITGTQTGKNEIVTLYGVYPDNVVVVPMPSSVPDTDFEDDVRTDFRSKYGITGEFLLYPAQFWPHKNHVNLLLALDQIRTDTGLELDLVLTGSDQGNLDHVRRVVASLGLGAQVHILGFVPRVDLDKLYRAAVALIYPSFFGPDNLPPLEAFARNCPVAAARVAGAEEQLESAALFFNPSDPADIARAILTLYRDNELRSELVRRGKRLVSARSPETYVARICQILDDLARIRRCWGTHYIASSS
jgi:glycosyltransferase involved in cell wall biosynthesis